MRMELNFEIKELELKKDNQSVWISFLKKAISSINGGAYFDRYFSGTNAKDYTFSIILPKPKFSPASTNTIRLSCDNNSCEPSVELLSTTIISNDTPFVFS